MATKQRTDLQVLRGLAVGSVVLYHLFPDQVPTGLLGVDVFFVLSGYLITGLLWRDFSVAEGVKELREQVVRFWARRARRLIPAALLVLVVTSLVAYAVGSTNWWLDIDSGWIWAVAYVANWFLAIEAADYLRADAPVSPYQHYWSLSVEEQFYIVLPILLAIVLLFVLKRRFRAVLITLTGLSVGSLVYALYMQGTDPAFGFYSSLTRVWEFGAGGLLALVQTRGKLTSLPQWLLAPTWIALVVVMLVPHDAKLLVFHNLVAIVLTVVAIIVSKDRLENNAYRPVKLLGDYSYSIYLWHWPILVLSPWILGVSILAADVWTQALALALIMAIAMLSKHLVEDPIRFGPFSKMKSGLQIGITVLVSASLIAASSVFNSSVRAEAEEVSISYNFTPALTDLADDKPISEEAEFIIRRDEAGFKVAKFGDRESDVRIALVGDSHARQYFVPLSELAETHGFGLDMISKSACSVQDPNNYQLDGFGGGLYCQEWNSELESYLASNKYDLLINSNSTLVHEGELAPAESYASAVAGWVEAGQQVLIIRDNAKPNVSDAINDFRFCIEQFGDLAVTECSTPIADALSPNDTMFDLGSALPGVESLDLTSLLCADQISCPVIIDDVIVYRDGSHMSLTFLKTLTGTIEAKLRQLGVL